LEVTVDEGTPVVVPLDSPELATKVQVPIARGLPRGHHQIQITASNAAVIDGFVVQDHPTWWLQRAVGMAAVVASLLALGWLFFAQRRHTR
jgi:hypothetical protein